MASRDTTSDNAALSVEVEHLRMKAEMVVLERIVAIAPTITDPKTLAEMVSLLAWAGQPGRSERPGP